MKVVCAYSGLELQVSHFPASLHNRECVHPVFYIPQKKLIQYLRKWGDAELTETDSYLLFLALLNSTGRVEFRTPAQFIPVVTTKLVASNMEGLARVISYTNVIQHPHFTLPVIVVGKDTANLRNVEIWIQDWMDCYKEFASGQIAFHEREKIKRREDLLQTFIKDTNKPIAHYARILSEWANSVGEFPQFPINIDGKSVRLCDYWKSIIIKCCKAESIFAVSESDLQELITHCEEYIPHGSIYSYTLMELLRAGAKRQKTYLGLGDMDLDTTTYKIIDATTSIEDANKQAMIDSAPKEKPVESAYPNRLAYLRASMKWEMAQDYAKQLEVAAAINTNIQTSETNITIVNGKVI